MLNLPNSIKICKKVLTKSQQQKEMKETELFKMVLA